MVDVDVLRYASRFTRLDGTGEVAITGDSAYENQESQGYRAVLEPLAGQDYAYDHAGDAPWSKDVAQVAVRFELWGDTGPEVDAAFDAILGAIRNIGTGKLWSVDEAGDERWCYAKLMGRLDDRYRGEQIHHKATAMRFAKLSDWFGDTAVEISETITTSPATVAVDNPGNGPVYWMEIRIRANTSGGFSNVTIENTHPENGYTLTGTRDSASADDEMRIDGELQTFEFSDDDGDTYVDDYASWTIGSEQVAAMRFEPGGQDLELTCAGTPNYDVEITFFPAWE